MDKRTRERLEAMAAFAHQIGDMMGQGKSTWNRQAIEQIAPDAMCIRARWWHYSNDPQMVTLFVRNFANGWQFANGAGDAYKEPTIELEQEGEANHVHQAHR